VKLPTAPNNLYLLADRGSALLGPIIGGGYDTLSNSQCAATGGYTVQVSGNTVSVDFSVIFTTAFVGTKRLFLSAVRRNGRPKLAAIRGDLERASRNKQRRIPLGIPAFGSSLRSTETSRERSSVFVSIPPPPKGSCSSPLQNNTSLATFPFPTRGGSGQWVCDSDSVMLLNAGGTLDSVKVVQDACSRCNDKEDFRGTNGHIDTLSSNQFCRQNDPNNSDYGNFYAIRLR